VKALFKQNFPLTLTKESAAIRQTEAAIDAFLRGDYDICITLAGAAEGIFSNRKGSDLHTFAMSHPRATEFGLKATNAAFNFERDWLKHSTSDSPEQITLTSFEAAMMLIRSMTKLANWSPKMDQIKPIIISVVADQQITDTTDL
jgi:hypothetical protein